MSDAVDRSGEAKAAITPAHDEAQTIRLMRHYRDHEPRSEDPNYHLFEQTRARLKRQGLLKCVIANADCAGRIELHHSHYEFAYINSIDIQQADRVLGLHLTEEDFAAWVEGPGNLEPLCQAHHVGFLGIHLIPTADWDTVRSHRVGDQPVVVESSTPLR